MLHELGSSITGVGPLKNGGVSEGSLLRKLFAADFHRTDVVVDGQELKGAGVDSTLAPEGA